MDCTLIIRTRDSIRRWEVDDWTVLAVIGSLSDEPETDEQLMVAVMRFGVEHRLKYRGQRLNDFPELDRDQTWCVVDLVGLAILAGGDFQLPGHQGAFEKDESDPPGGASIVWIALPAYWLLQPADDSWRSLLQARAAQQQRRERLDVRSVLFGPALWEHLAHGLLAAARSGLPPTPEDELQRTRAIHAQWLMTARPDLLDRSPRDWLLKNLEEIDHEYFQRTQQWSAEGKPPLPLDENSNAYRFGGFGTVQVVFYFEMIRALLKHGWHCIRSTPGLKLDQLRQLIGDYQPRWLNAPDEETGSRTPQQWIDAERRRVPLTTEGMIDCDCPICQAQADGFFGTSVGFEMIDSHQLEMEDEFAFSTTKDRREWELNQQRSREEESRWQQEFAARRAQDTKAEDALQSAWQATHVDWDGPPLFDNPLAEGSLRIGFCLAEIVGDLKQLPNGRERIVRLNNAYRDFRRSDSLAVAREAALQLCRELEEAAAAYPALIAKSSDLQSHIHEVMRSITI